MAEVVAGFARLGLRPARFGEQPLAGQAALAEEVAGVEPPDVDASYACNWRSALADQRHQ